MHVSFIIPVKTVSELNVREYWGVRAKRAKSQRVAAYISVLAHAGKAFRPLTCAVVVTLTRISPRPLDDDNLVGSQKHVRDGIADGLGVNDRDTVVSWRYAQCRGGKGVYAVDVRIERAEEA